MENKNFARSAAFLSLVAIVLSAFPSPLLAQNVQVTSATPPAAPQGTINLNVAVGGNGFGKGAKAAFFLSGTTNPAGVTVNSTAFNSKSQVTANITISDTANISSFDVVVTNTDGRSGKGTQLFQVTAKGTPVGCTTVGTPSAFSLVTSLNSVNSSGAAQYGNSLGLGVRTSPAVLNFGTQSRTVLLAAAGTGSGKMEIFLLDPASGSVLDGQALFQGSAVQPHITAVYDPTGTVPLQIRASGDINADGIPDFAGGGNGAFVAVSNYDSTMGVLSYSTIQLQPPPSNPGKFGAGIAIGKLDASAWADEVAVGASNAGTKKKPLPSAVFIYQYNGAGFDLVSTLDNPLGGSGFGNSVAIADVTGDGAPDLVVGDPNNSVLVFPSPLTSPSFFYTLSTSNTGVQGLGSQVGAGSVTSLNATDVIAATYWGGSVINVSIFSGPITSSRTNPSFTYSPDPRLSAQGWASDFSVGDMLGTGQADILVGIPNAGNSSSCKSPGAGELFFPSASNLTQPTFTFQPSALNSEYGGYGWGVGVVPAVSGNINLNLISGYTPLILVGETGRLVGSTSGAGQVYVYKKN